MDSQYRTRESRAEGLGLEMQCEDIQRMELKQPT